MILYIYYYYFYGDSIFFFKFNSKFKHKMIYFIMHSTSVPFLANSISILFCNFLIFLVFYETIILLYLKHHTNVISNITPHFARISFLSPNQNVVCKFNISNKKILFRIEAMKTRPRALVSWVLYSRPDFHVLQV